jgi:hypothetical protein
MKIENIKELPGIVSSQTDVILILDSKEEAQKLRDALAVVDRYRKVAFKALKDKHIEPERSDWYSVSYCVKNDKVIVSIKDGMAG